MTEILCRFDADKRLPVVFIPASIDGPNILCWIDGKESVVPLDYYHMTGPLSAADEEVLRQRYAIATGDSFVKIRHRLPRVARVLENVLSKPKAGSDHTTPLSVRRAPKPVAGPAVRRRTVTPASVSTAQATPADVLAAIEAARQDFATRMDAIMSSLSPAPSNKK